MFCESNNVAEFVYREQGSWGNKEIELLTTSMSWDNRNLILTLRISEVFTTGRTNLL